MRSMAWPAARSRRNAASASTSGSSGTRTVCLRRGPYAFSIMKVVVAHNRYASGQPSGENVIVDAEIAQLGAAGVTVLPLLRSSDEIGSFSTAQKVLLPLSPIRNGASQRA